MRLKLIFAVLVGVLLVAAPGCGSKKKSAATTTVATTTQATTSTTSTTSAGGNALSGTDCQKLTAASQTFANVTSGNVPKDINAQLARVKALAAVAPAAVKGDFVVLAQAGSAYAKLGLKSGQQPTAAQMQQLLATLNIPKLTQALQHLSAWAQKNCSAG